MITIYTTTKRIPYPIRYSKANCKALYSNHQYKVQCTLRNYTQVQLMSQFPSIYNSFTQNYMQALAAVL